VYGILKESKILVVENNPDHSALIIDTIEKECRKEVILKRDGLEAMDYFWRNGIFGQIIPVDVEEKEKHPPIDLVILDLNLSKVHGMDVLKFLKRNPMYQSIPVAIISTRYDDKTIEEAYENGAAEFISKSTCFQVFIEKIKLLSKYVSCTNTTVSVENFCADPDKVARCETVLIDENV
jgi:CheY-like chemotaxis protein